MTRVAVFYLARMAHGIDGFAPFATSYLKHPSGHEHDLILLGKGMTKAGQRAATSFLFKDAPHTLIQVPDDGYDIHAYLRAARDFDHEYMLFCNTYTEFLTDDWLAKMMAAAQRSGVGLVGATASYESIQSSVRLISKAVWLANSKVTRFDRYLADQMGQILLTYAPYWMAAQNNWRAGLRRFVGDRLKRRPDPSRFDDEFEEHWRSLVSHGGPLEGFDTIPPFPNPHVRSNVFLIKRDLLLSFKFDLADTKWACNLFESGPEGMPSRVQDLGLEQCLVGADGRIFSVDEWPASETFRLGNQANLLASDNQTRAYTKFSSGEKLLHARMSWGDYLGPAPSTFRSLGIKFPKARPATPRQAQPSVASETVFSVVIPTHNRLQLVADAIETVRRQDYPRWELVVFDNCSTEPVAAHVDGLRDPRVRVVRSDDFLPVTDSWNRAFDEAKGDYVILIGDDDGLTPAFFDRMNRLVQTFGKPDLIYGALYQFFHPGVAPWQREGYVSELPNGFFFQQRLTPFVLGNADRAKAVRGSLSIRRNFTFNMQAFVFSRRLIEKIRHNNKFFHSPFPDYYMANVAFAKADKVVVDPSPTAIAGVSRASFGFTLFNNLEDVGSKMLNTDLETDHAYRLLKDQLLPGPSYLTKYLVTMQHVAEQVGDGAAPDVMRYRRMQILSFVRPETRGLTWMREEAGKVLWNRLTVAEKAWAVRLSLSRQAKSKDLKSFYQHAVADLDATAFRPIEKIKNVGDYTRTIEVFESLADNIIGMSGRIGERHTPPRHHPEMDPDGADAESIVASLSPN